jgi:hypothetical protein
VPTPFPKNALTVFSMNFACRHNSKCTWSVRYGQSFSIEDGSVGGRSAEAGPACGNRNFIRDTTGFVWNTIATGMECRQGIRPNGLLNDRENPAGATLRVGYMPDGKVFSLISMRSLVTLRRQSSAFVRMIHR